MKSNWIEDIKVKDFDKSHFVKECLSNKNFRDDLIVNLRHKDIMVYYHCYYVVKDAILINQEIFYEYIDLFIAMLTEKNSYYREIALTMIAKLSKVDYLNKIDDLLELYMSLLNDPKFMTGHSCVKNLVLIAKNKESLKNKIINELLTLHNRNIYEKKQYELMKFDVLLLVESTYEVYKDKEKLYNYINESCNSISPKTRKKAKSIKKLLLL